MAMRKLYWNDRLKEARTALDSERFRDAENVCREVLAADPNNYMALVLLAAALRDTPETPVLLERAISIKPTAPLAHRGLAKYYADDPRRDPPGFFLSHLRLYDLKEIDRGEMIRRICAAAERLGNYDECCRTLLRMHEKEDEAGRAELAAALVEIMCGPTPTALEEDPTLYEKLVESIDESDFPTSLIVKYFNCLLQHNSFDAVLEKYSEVERFRSNPLLTEKICNIFLKKKLLDRSEFQCDVDKIKAAIDRMLTFDPRHRLGPSCRALLCLLENAPLNAYSILSAAQKRDDILESLLKALCCLELGRWMEAEVISRPLVDNVDYHVAVIAKRILFTSLCSQKNSTKCTEGLDLAKNVGPPYDLWEEVARFDAYLTLERFDDARKTLEILADSIYYDSLNALLHERLHKIDEAIEILKQNENNFLNLLLLGIFYITYKNDYPRAFTPLLQSAKMNPHKFMTFYFLGKLYEHHENNKIKAKKCYIKTLELNPECLKAAKKLSEIYMETQEWEANYALLHSIIDSFSHIARHECQWAWLQLGLHHIGRDEWDDAIVNLRTYMRLNSSDPDAWMILADSYYQRGSYTSALKCYQKTIDIDPNKTHCSVQMGTIQCLLRQYDEALQTFLTISDDYLLPGLKGLGEVKFCMAKEFFSKSLYRECREYTQDAIDTICEAILLQNELICLWTILYKVIFLIAELPQKHRYFYFNPNFTTENTKNKNKYNNEEIYKVAIDCIKITINYATDAKSNLYNDLAFVYYKLYGYTKNRNFIDEAYSIIQKSIEIEKEWWQHWNLLGIISSSRAITKYDIAQHAFIKALELDPTNCVLWSNLGVFYCIIGNNLLANQSFMKAQESNPTYVKSWIGQALIAEVVDEIEAIDLFRHASQLSFNLESSSKYGYWVANTLCSQDENSLSSKHLKGSTHAILSACDLMSIYCEFEEKNAWNLNIYGILLEKIGRYKCATRLFQMARENVERIHLDKVLSNLGRLYYKMKNYDLAIETLLQISEFNINSFNLLALAYFKTNQFGDSYETYTKTLKSLAKTEDEKIQLIVGMACVLMHTDRASSGKMMLIQVTDYNIKNPSITALTALCVYGLLNSDPKLAMTILVRLKKTKKLPNFILIVLDAYFLLKFSSRSAAIKFVAKHLHRYPTNPLLWELLVKLSTNNIAVTRVAATKAITLGTMIEFKTSTALACISGLLAGDCKNGLILAQKALFMDPGNSKNWAMLIFAIQKNPSLCAKMKPWIRKATSHLTSNFTLDDAVQSWLSNSNKYL